jgi:hypothetical protein
MAQPSRAQDAAALAGEVIQDPDLSYTASFAMECSAVTWNRLVDDPVLAGQLWSAYGYAPAYRVTMRADTIHVEDPTGLVGDAVRIGQEAGDRTYLVYGKLNHWADPFFNEGLAVMAVHSRSVDGRVNGTVEVSLRSWMAKPPHGSKQRSGLERTPDCPDLSPPIRANLTLLAGGHRRRSLLHGTPPWRVEEMAVEGVGVRQPVLHADGS